MNKINVHADNLCRELRKLKTIKNVDFKGLLAGTPEAYVKFFRDLFVEENHELCRYLVNKSFDLNGLTDYKFMELLYRIMRDVFEMRPPINQNQFFSAGFVQRKLDLASALVVKARQIISEIDTKSGRKSVQSAHLMKSAMIKPNARPSSAFGSSTLRKQRRESPRIKVTELGDVEDDYDTETQNISAPVTTSKLHKSNGSLSSKSQKTKSKNTKKSTPTLRVHENGEVNNNMQMGGNSLSSTERSDFDPNNEYFISNPSNSSMSHKSRDADNYSSYTNLPRGEAQINHISAFDGGNTHGAFIPPGNSYPSTYSNDVAQYTRHSGSTTTDETATLRNNTRPTSYDNQKYTGNWVMPNNDNNSDDSSYRRHTSSQSNNNTPTSSFNTTTDRAANATALHAQYTTNGNATKYASDNMPNAISSNQMDKIMHQFDTIISRMSLIENRMSRIENKLEAPSNKAQEQKPLQVNNKVKTTVDTTKPGYRNQSYIIPANHATNKTTDYKIKQSNDNKSIGSGLKKQLQEQTICITPPSEKNYESKFNMSRSLNVTYKHDANLTNAPGVDHELIGVEVPKQHSKDNCVITDFESMPNYGRNSYSNGRQLGSSASSYNYPAYQHPFTSMGNGAGAVDNPYKSQHPASTASIFSVGKPLVATGGSSSNPTASFGSSSIVPYASDNHDPPSHQHQHNKYPYTSSASYQVSNPLTKYSPHSFTFTSSNPRELNEPVIGSISSATQNPTSGSSTSGNNHNYYPHSAVHSTNKVIIPTTANSAFTSSVATSSSASSIIPSNTGFTGGSLSKSSAMTTNVYTNKKPPIASDMAQHRHTGILTNSTSNNTTGSGSRLSSNRSVNGSDYNYNNNNSKSNHTNVQSQSERIASMLSKTQQMLDLTSSRSQSSQDDEEEEAEL